MSQNGYGINLKWVPTWAMLADALTKAKATIALVKAMMSSKHQFDQPPEKTPLSVTMKDSARTIVKGLVAVRLPSLAASQGSKSWQVSADMVQTRGICR